MNYKQSLANTHVEIWSHETSINNTKYDACNRSFNIFESLLYLQGDGFCGTTPDAEACGSIIEMTMPYAMPVLSMALSEASLDLCTDVAMAC